MIPKALPCENEDALEETDLSGSLRSLSLSYYREEKPEAARFRLQPNYTGTLAHLS